MKKGNTGALGPQGHFHHNEHLQPRVTLCGERGSTEDRSPGLRGWMNAGNRKACDDGFWSAGRRVVVLKRQNTGPCQSIEGEAVDITRLQVPPRAP